ncbi:MFS transporter [Kitasatospora kazusensis]|uniref:MFS transporter n=1 Tax=Kitasatospora kazusensis TaxID=407974 RepID=A0ABN2ZAM3_9ACTN
MMLRTSASGLKSRGAEPSSVRARPVVAQWRQPLGPVFLAALVLSLGRGAWFTCWATFFVRYASLSPGQFAVGMTLAGVVGLLAGGPVGYLADRLGLRETLMVVGAVQGLAICSYAFLHGFAAIIAAGCFAVAAERAAPGVRIALISGLTSGEERLSSLATARSLNQAGIVVGALIGAIVLSFDSRAGYLALILLYGGACFGFSLLLLRAPHVASLRDRGIKQRALAVRDAPFLAVCFFNGMLALNWGMLDVGVPLWITRHTHAPLWTTGVLIGFNAVVVVLFQKRAAAKVKDIPGAARMGLWSGVVLALSCAVFACSFRGTGLVVVAVLLVAALVHVVGELAFVSSGFGLSVELAPEDRHGEYQGMFGLAQSGALMLAPGLMSVLLAELGAAGWFVLMALFLVGGVGTLAAARWAMASSPFPSSKRG